MWYWSPRGEGLELGGVLDHRNEGRAEGRYLSVTGITGSAESERTCSTWVLAAAPEMLSPTVISNKVIIVAADIESVALRSAGWHRRVGRHGIWG